MNAEPYDNVVTAVLTCGYCGRWFCRHCNAHADRQWQYYNYDRMITISSSCELVLWEVDDGYIRKISSRYVDGRYCLDECFELARTVDEVFAAHFPYCATASAWSQRPSAT